MRKVRTYRMESWDEYINKVMEGYENWAFRGQADSKWPLMSTLGRYLNNYVDEKYWKMQEERILRIFQRKAHLFLTHVPDLSNTFQWLALMQHHGAPTRLLDFTWSPYVATFFALERTTTPAAVWAINPEKLVGFGARQERFEEFLENPKLGAIGQGEPFIMNKRLIAQSGTFIVARDPATPIEDIVSRFNRPEDTLVKFELSAELVRPVAMRTLYSMNITQATLFPGLDGLARSFAYELEFNWEYDPRKIK
jgi:hypothetical protein